MNKQDRKSLFGIILILLIISALLGAHSVKKYINSPNVNLRNNSEYSLYICDTMNFEHVLERLIMDSVLINQNKFTRLAKKENYVDNIRPGRYVIKNGMSNKEMIHLLKLGEQTPVKVVFNSARNIYVLASRISKQIEADSASLVDKFLDSIFLASLEFTPNNAYLMLIPNTYEFYWNTKAEDFWKRMKKESTKFWSEERKAKAFSIRLTLEEVVTLASIVERETNTNDEKGTIAGVYINRLEKRIKLQADPTLVFIANDPYLQRVKNFHKEIDSPYNTYKYYGLPPGPIWISSISSIDAVLNYEKHDYIFFCASSDFSGRHNFAKTYAQHLQNAVDYRKALDDRDIR